MTSRKSYVNTGPDAFDKPSTSWDIPCQLRPLFCRPSAILLKFGVFVGLDEKMCYTKFQVFNQILVVFDIERLKIRHKIAA